MYAPQQYPDATADFYANLNDPTKWLIRQGVPIFKAHKRTDPATGQKIEVDLPKLHRIAANMARQEQLGGVPVRGTLGHTEPGKPETQQPPVALWYRNHRVAPFGPKGEPAIVADEWLDPQYAADRKNFPYRSAEYYDDTEQITGVALLTRDPFLDLGVVSYGGGQKPTFYTKSVPGPVRYSATGAVRPAYLFLLGDQPVNPQNPQDPNGNPAGLPNPTYYGAPLPGPAPAYNPQPATGYAPPQQPVAPAYAPPAGVPVPYGYPQQQQNRPPAGYGYPQQQPGNRPAAPYGDMGYTPHHNIGHPQGVGEGWNLGGVAYNPHGGHPGHYGEPPPPMPGMHQEPEAMEEETGGLDALHHHLSQLSAHLSHHMARMAAKRTSSHYEPNADNAPFPAGPQMPSGTADAPYARQPQRPGGYYSRQQPPAPGTTTISGLPVGYQLEVDKLRGQIAQQDQALKMLMYERDQADTDSCVAEIRRLAEAGFNVGELELSELKNKPRDQRRGYLELIVTKYEKGPGQIPLPQIMGDPTAAMAPPDANRPLTEEEMNAALNLTRTHRMEYSAAIQAIRYGQQPQQGMPTIPGVQFPPGGPTVFGPHGEQAVPFNDDYYPQPSANGQGGY